MSEVVSTRSIWNNPIHFLAFGFGSGLISVMPGTFGTLMAIPFYLILQNLQPLWYALIVILFFIAGIFICGRTARDLNAPDYQGIVWDEMVGYLLTMFLMPSTWFWIAAGFVFFRIMDIWKPWPIRWVNRHVHGGFGIMIDDAMAAFFAWIVLQLLLLLWQYLYSLTF